jgi:hypothetical protein
MVGNLAAFLNMETIREADPIGTSPSTLRVRMDLGTHVDFRDYLNQGHVYPQDQALRLHYR